MKLLLRALLLAVLVLAPALATHAARQKPSRPTAKKNADLGTYRGYIVIDAATGRVLAEENADIVNPPASMTKLMTYAVLHDRLQTGALSLQTPVRIDISDSRMGGTQVYLDPRETFSVEELIYAMMIHSANDAAHALARTAAGSIPAFIELMNAKARALGMNRTVFRTPHGLTSERQPVSEGDITTPRDYALLCRHLIRQTDILTYTSVERRPFGPARATGPLDMANSNKLVGKIAGVDGLKTGYTKNAGYCLSATAERNGRRVITVIMGCFGPAGSEIDRGKSRDLKTIELIELGFTHLASAPASPAEATPRPPAPTPAPKPAVKNTPPPAPKPAAKPAATAKPAPAAAKPETRTAKPETPASPPAPAEESPVSPVASAEESPFQSAEASPVAPAAESSGEAPSVKFVLPPKK